MRKGEKINYLHFFLSFVFVFCLLPLFHVDDTLSLFIYLLFCFVFLLLFQLLNTIKTFVFLPGNPHISIGRLDA